MLLTECSAAEVTIVRSCRITEVRRTTEYVVDTSLGEYSAPALVCATGGLSIPKAGATSFGYDLARKFGIRIAATRPALVPLTFNEDDTIAFRDLTGISTSIVASFNGTSFREGMLFTHRGLSGPAILQISSYWDGSRPVIIDLLPGTNFSQAATERKRAGDRSAFKTMLGDLLPRRLAERWLELHDGANMLLPDLDASLHAWEFRPAGTEGYAKAEVTAGGIHPDEISSQTMEARRAPGLYFIGEVVDVTGHLGGFNFQWAWASGAAAGRSL
jgi:predicted Rossmann fold flavoprotein